MPPKNPVTMFAMPCPMDSRVLLEWVSVRSSTSLAVMSDSMSPTRASASAYGAMIFRVSKVNGTSGRPGVGRDEGSTPLSPTVGTAIPAPMVRMVSAAIEISGAGITVVSLGNSAIKASPPISRA
jgi:hypothetical protein